MLTKGKITLFMTLCILSLVSIGFASWTISEESKEEVLGSMLTDEVLNSKEYVILDTNYGRIDELGNKTGIDWFDYEQSGYLDSNGTYTDTGHIITYYKIDRDKCKLLLNEYNSLKVSIILKYANNNNSDLNIFASHKSTNESNSGMRTFTHTININDCEYDITSTLNGRQYIIDLTFINIIDSYVSGDDDQFIYFSIDYSFFATTGPYFNQFIYRYLYGDDIDFSVSLQVSGCNYEGGIS